MIAFWPFGDIHEVSIDTGALKAQEYRFPGQWFQAETGLHQNWHRDYDPTTGRYIQADPLGLVDGASVYGYALQSPLVYIDHDGRVVAAPIVIGAISGAAGGFISSGGCLHGTVVGAAAGAGLGATGINPLAGALLASVVGQGVGSILKGCGCEIDPPDNLAEAFGKADIDPFVTAGSVIGFGTGRAIGAGVNRAIRPKGVRGLIFSTRGRERRRLRDLGRTGILEGVGAVTGEVLGGRIE